VFFLRAHISESKSKRELFLGALFIDFRLSTSATQPGKLSSFVGIDGRPLYEHYRRDKIVSLEH
jgi:hypothetical protein